MAQIVIDNKAVLTTPRAMVQAIDDNFDELYMTRSAVGLSPMAYGAVGNGTTNDTVAVQNCINAAAAANVPVIINKLYQLNDMVTVPNGVSILGHHRDTCGFLIKRASFNLSALGVLNLTISDKYAGSIENIQITTDMDTTLTVRSSLTVFPPLIRAVGVPRFFIKGVRLNKATIGIDATGNSGGAHISDCEIGAYVCGLKMNGALDFMFVNNVEFWPFGIADTNSAAIYADGTNLAIDAKDVDGVAFGNISTFWCGTKMDGCFGSIASLNLDGNYSWLKCLGTSRVQELVIGSMYKTSAVANDLCISVAGTYRTLLSVGSAMIKQTANLTTTAGLISCSQGSSSICISNLTAELVGVATRLASITAGHLMLSNAEIMVDATSVRTQSCIYATASEIQVNNLKAAALTGSGVLLQMTQNLRHNLSSIVAPGWTLSLPTVSTLITLADVDTNTIVTNTRLAHALRRYKVTAVFNASGTATITPPISDYTKYVSITAFADYGTTYKVAIDGSKIAIGNSAITVTTGITAYSGLTCEAWVEVIVD